jgi:thiamine biosynthesis protein ThiS
VQITLNGDPYDLAEPLTIGRLLANLEIDPHRVAVEQNLVIVKRASYDVSIVQPGDQIEIINFVGGG